MAQAQAPMQGQEQEEFDPLAVLQGELQSQASAFTLEAMQMGVEGARVAETLRTTPEFQRVAQTTSVDDYYARIIGPNATVINTFPPGAKVSSGGGKNIKQIVDPKSGETIVFADYAASTQLGNKQDDTKVMAAVIENTGRTGQEPFNLSEAMTKMKTLSGDALLDYVGSTVVNIDIRVAAEEKRIRQIAALESGYISARAAYERNLSLDATAILPDGRPFASLGQASAQTLQAKALMDQNFTISERMAGGLLTSDSKIAELKGARQIMTTLEARRAAREQRASDVKEQKDAIRDEKREALVSAVTPQEVTNYRVLTGADVDDETARLAIVQPKIAKDKVLSKLIQVTPENIYLSLVSSDKQEQNGAFKLALAYEKAVNPRIPSDATTTPSLNHVKAVLLNPKLLIPFIPEGEERQEFARKVSTPGSSKDIREAFQGKIAAYLPAYIENKTQEEFNGDMRLWAGIKHPELQKSIAEITATGPMGKAPLGSVIENFMARPITDATGKPVTLDVRLQALDEAIMHGVTGIPKSMFVTPEAIQAQQLQLQNFVKNYGARVYVRNTLLKRDPVLPGQVPDYVQNNPLFRDVPK